MRALPRIERWFGAAIVLGAFLTACGGGGNQASQATSTGAPSGSTGTNGTGGAGGMSSSSTFSSSSSSGMGGMGTGGMGTGGMGNGGGTGMHGPSATQSVSAGEVCKSPSYRMVFTLGQPTQNQTKTTSPGYRMQGGLIGATETLP